MRGQWQKWFYYYNKCQEAKALGGLAISVTNYSFNREIQNATERPQPLSCVIVYMFCQNVNMLNM